MTKIVFVLPDMAGGGTERVVALLANEFVGRGYPVAILLFAGNQVAYPLDPRVEVCVTGEASGGKLSVRLKRIVNMRRFYKKNKDCYIFAFSVMGAVFSVVTAAGIPHRMLVSERNDPTKYDKQNIRNWAYTKAEKIVAQTTDMLDCLPAKIRDKMVVIPNPVPADIPAAFEGERKKQVVSVARLQPQKNQKLLIESFSDFSKMFPNYELHIFGVGELEAELRSLAEELGVAEKVVFRGFSNHIKEDIRESAMFVLSSDYEGISNSMIEALALGLPVISTDCPIGGSRAYIQDGVSGLLTGVGNRKELALAMCKVAENPAFAEKLSRNAVMVKEKFSLAKIADRFLQEAGIV